MSDGIYELLLGWSWEQIERQGMTDAMRWAMWRRFHPWLAALLDGAFISGTSMLRPGRFF